jgi:aryl-alcohol dehydrogenase (NADP+)
MYQERYFHDREFDAVDAFQKVAAEAGLKPPTLAVAWVLHRPAITAPIIGASRAEQLADTLAAVEADVSPDLVARLNDLTADFRKGDAPR